MLTMTTATTVAMTARRERIERGDEQTMMLPLPRVLIHRA
jgi:hypothetical protein